MGPFNWWLKSAGGLLLGRSADGADGCASAAADAAAGIDLVMICALRNSANGAAGFAGTAADALIGNYICHGIYLHRIYHVLF